MSDKKNNEKTKNVNAEKQETNANVEKKVLVRVPTGYALSSSFYGNTNEQSGIIRTGRYTENGLSIKAGVIYKEGTPTFEAIEALSETLRRRMFRVATFEMREKK